MSHITRPATSTTATIPTHIPAWKISPTISQLLSSITNAESIAIFITVKCLMVLFHSIMKIHCHKSFIPQVHPPSLGNFEAKLFFNCENSRNCLHNVRKFRVYSFEFQVSDFKSQVELLLASLDRDSLVVAAMHRSSTCSKSQRACFMNHHSSNITCPSSPVLVLLESPQ